MLLAIAATEFEMRAFRDRCRIPRDRLVTMLSGVGLLESAVNVSRFLEKHRTEISTVLNFGIGGAYLKKTGELPVDVLDLCLATSEILGDFGVCSGLAVEPFPDPALCGPTSFDLDRSLIEQAETVFEASALSFHAGPFVTVNAASSSAARGTFMRDRHRAVCENMEGGAIARVCEMFSLPLVEIRAISNLVEDRPGSPWKLQEASERAAQAAILLVQEIQEIP